MGESQGLAMAKSSKNRGISSDAKSSLILATGCSQRMWDSATAQQMASALPQFRDTYRCHARHSRSRIRLDSVPQLRVLNPEVSAPLTTRSMARQTYVVQLATTSPNTITSASPMRVLAADRRT